MKTTIDNKGLCYRCEYRALFYEHGISYCAECGMKDFAVSTCYMYRPVLPFIVKSNDGDKRPLFSAWFISGRAKAVNPLSDKDCVLEIVKYKRNMYVPLWRLKTNEEKIKDIIKKYYMMIYFAYSRKKYAIVSFIIDYYYLLKDKLFNKNEN